MKKLGGGGPLPISHAELLPEMEPFRKMLTRAWTSMGEKVSENIYDGEMNGLTHCVDTIYRGQRSRSYLFLKNKPNVTVLAGAHSKRLIIECSNRTYKGVIVVDSSRNEMSFFA
ncbi:hypothetical protein CGCVW01_v008782 [Colletotrichum viniferum]|nr:hypothetical protein CGCVW01_v008782 [Colletotrichum viniferum]